MASSSLQSPTFPLEIFHLIVKNLAYSELSDNYIVLNIEVLRQCSLVCRAWVPICQAYLFKSGKVDLERLSDSGPEKGIIRAIAAHPQFASYVQKIRYTAKVGVQVGHIPDQNIHTLLTLPNLRSFDLNATSLGGSLSRKFNDLCTGDLVFSRLWADYISSSLTSLTDLTLNYIEDVHLVSFLSCPNLKSLSLNECDCVDWKTQPTSSTVPRTSKLENLKLSSVRNVSYAFLGSISHLKRLSVHEAGLHIQPRFKDQFMSTFQGLEKLTIDYRWLDNRPLLLYLPLSMASGMGIKLFEQLQDLTAMPESEQEAAEVYQTLQHAPNIRYLDVTFQNSSLIPYLNIHRFLPQHVGSLRTLHIRFDIEDFSQRQSLDTIEVLSKALSLVQSPASLEELVMTLKIDIAQLLTLFGLIQQLKTLDTALFVDSTMFPLLRWITFRICLQSPATLYYPPNVDNKVQADLYGYIESSFPAFRGSSNSRINLVVWVYEADR
ncbi:hypothetical protein BJ165DRAFT_1404951 [Panaeolus papilionaceus]|nr:hypothetical protein BJ165DRAFT_1404951 [Panaeolus papilionaceus]